MKFIDNLVGKGLSYWVIIQVITLNLAWMVTLAGPMAVLVATLMAFGSLSSSNEITVMQSSGLSLVKMMFPVLIMSGLLCWGLILFNNKVLPEANHRTKVLMNDIQRTKPTFVIEQGKFTDDIGGYNLLVKKTFPESNKLEGVFIIDNSNPNELTILTAKSGDISYSKDYSKVIIELYDGEIHLLNKQNVYEDYRKVLFTKHIVSINAEGFGFSKSDENALSRGDRELSADSMRNIVNKIQSDYEIDKAKSVEAVKQLALDYQNIKFKSEIKADSVKNKANELFVQSLQNRYRGFRTKYMSQKQMELSNHRQTDTYLVEIYKKYSIPFACVVFVMIGAPLGVITRRGGFGVAAGMSLGFFLLYWSCLIGGEKLADREMLSPFLSMWTANFVLGAVGLYLTFRNSINFKKIFKRI
jgi:lipopolysaccharide export system permease protein